MDTETRNYLQSHAISMAQKAIEGDLLSRAILNLFFKYRAWKATREEVNLLRDKVAVYRRRVEKEMQHG